jgi:hypothetical protein
MKKCGCGHAENKHPAGPCKVWGCGCHKYRHDSTLDRVDANYARLRAVILREFANAAMGQFMGGTVETHEETTDRIIERLRSRK